MARILATQNANLAGPMSGLAGEEAYSGLQELLLAATPNGRLWVTPGHYQTTGDAAVQLNSANDMIAVRIVPQTDIRITSISRYVTALVSQGNGTFAICADDDGDPGDVLQTLGTLSSGDTADVWTRLAVVNANQYQLYRNTAYWLRMQGADGADWSESVRRPNTTTGSETPDEMTVCKVSTDGGSSWTEATQDSKPALWNVVINSVADKHVPQLCYGCFNNKHIYIPGIGMMEVPEEAILLDCSGLTADTEYYVYAYSNTDTRSGDVLVEASATVPAIYDGIEVKTGDTGHRYIGRAYAKTLISTHQGPTDRMDQRLVANRYNRFMRKLGKLCPYVANTSETPATSWAAWMSGGYTLETLGCGSIPVIISAKAFPSPLAGQYIFISFGVDSTNIEYRGLSKAALYGQIPHSLEITATMRLDQGYHTITPIMKGSAASGFIYYFYQTYDYADVMGAIEA